MLATSAAVSLAVHWSLMLGCVVELSIPPGSDAMAGDTSCKAKKSLLLVSCRVERARELCTLISEVRDWRHGPLCTSQLSRPM